MILHMLMRVTSNSFTRLRFLFGTHRPRHSGRSQPASSIGGFDLCWEDDLWGPIDQSHWTKFITLIIHYAYNVVVIVIWVRYTKKSTDSTESAEGPVLGSLLTIRPEAISRTLRAITSNQSCHHLGEQKPLLSYVGHKHICPSSIRLIFRTAIQLALVPRELFTQTHQLRIHHWRVQMADLA